MKKFVYHTQKLKRSYKSILVYSAFIQRNGIRVTCRDTKPCASAHIITALIQHSHLLSTHREPHQCLHYGLYKYDIDAIKMNDLENNHRLKGEDGGFGASRLFLWEELLPHWGSSSSFKSSSSCSLESSRNIWKWGGNRDRSVILLLMVPSECPACAHLLPSCSGNGTKPWNRPICARVHCGGHAPPGQSSVQLSREGGTLGVHVVLHPDGPRSQHIIQTSGSFVMDGEAWHAAVHGSQRVGHNWATELDWEYKSVFKKS